ncbi:hypothetical protein V0288_01880 [Pannus brasiliensis CCIBt3594]|uniref:Uncharacterized protein n=1 Tax=Pannus brasiliensis CCIBt3594 TaxID=1427578 RepID=A0AAW9QTI4_9CHRO
MGKFFGGKGHRKREKSFLKHFTFSLSHLLPPALSDVIAIDMTRQFHDRFAKDYLEELLSPLGTVKTSEKVKGEIREIDVRFEPDSIGLARDLPLGLFGKIAVTSCSIEPFRNPPSEIEIRGCSLK